MPHKIPVILNADPTNYVEYTDEQIREYEHRRFMARNYGERPTYEQLTKIIEAKNIEMVTSGSLNSNSTLDEYGVERTDGIMVGVIRYWSNSQLTIKWIPAELRNYYAIVQPNKDDFAEEIVFNLDKYRKDNPDKEGCEFNKAYIYNFDSSESGELYENSANMS